MLNKIFYLSMFFILGLGLISSKLVSQIKEPVEYVDPNIGGVGHLLQPTVPIVHLPNSMIRLAPLRTPEVLDKYLAPKIYEFPLSITSHRIADAFALMPLSGKMTVNRETAASEYDHDQETSTPYYYSVLLEDCLNRDSHATEYCVENYYFCSVDMDFTPELTGGSIRFIICSC